jgi:hypothetical protein
MKVWICDKWWDYGFKKQKYSVNFEKNTVIKINILPLQFNYLKNLSFLFETLNVSLPFCFVTTSRMVQVYDMPQRRMGKRRYKSTPS